jgi:hypothetical protein
MSQLKTCSRCEVPQPLTQYYRQKGAKDGVRAACKTCLKDEKLDRAGRDKELRKLRYQQPEVKARIAEYSKKKWADPESRAKMEETAKQWRMSLGGKYSTYKKNAKRRNLEWDLTPTQFEEYWQKPCTYCGDEVETIGVDRMDSSKGYTVENTTPCCRTCNTIKMALTTEEFMSKITQIHKYYVLKEDT